MTTVQMAPLTALKQRATRFGLGLGLAATLALGAVMPTLAASDPGLTITGTPVSAAAGTLTYSLDGQAADSSAAIALDGKAHSIAIVVPVHAVDHSGDDAGWHTTFSLSTFKTGSGGLLGEGALGVTAAGSAACDTSASQVCSNNNAAVTNGVSPTTYTTGGGALSVFSSDAGAHVSGIGMGQYDYDTTLTLAVPSTAKAGTYASTLTVTAVTAP